MSKLHEILSFRDVLNAAEFWFSFSSSDKELAVTICESQCYIHYFHRSRHPGYACYTDLDLPKFEYTFLKFQGCDPKEGIQVRNEALCSVARATLVIESFFKGEPLARFGWVEM